MSRDGKGHGSLWIICGMCGSDEIKSEIVKDYHDIDGDNFQDGISFSCANCATIFDDVSLGLTELKTGEQHAEV